MYHFSPKQTAEFTIFVLLKPFISHFWRENSNILSFKQCEEELHLCKEDMKSRNAKVGLDLTVYRNSLCHWRGFNMIHLTFTISPSSAWGRGLLDSRTHSYMILTFRKLGPHDNKAALLYHSKEEPLAWTQSHINETRLKYFLKN